VGRIHLGTSGYVYNHWRGIFYPEGMPPRRWLARYASVFSTVELNNTFYRLPTPASVDGWREGTPHGFRFAAKGSRFLTHMKKLTDTDVGLRRFFDPIERLGDKLDVVLWQLPRQMDKPDLDKLERFLAALPRHVRHCFEFRSLAWYTRDVCRVLDLYGAAFCEHDLVAAPPPRTTGGFRYLRFHGASAPYTGRYGTQALRPFARSLRRYRDAGGEAYVYFNNDLGGHALFDALDLARLLGEDLRVELADPSISP